MPSIDDIINRQFRQWEAHKMERGETSVPSERPMEIVTVSREAGSRGGYFASVLADRMKYQLVHKEIVDAICASSGYRKRIVASLDDRYRSRLGLMVEAMVTGQAVDHADYARHLATVVLSMARLGGVVLVGRGGNFILGPERGFHIRFVCPRDVRLANLTTYDGMTKGDAANLVKRSDEERRALMRKVFNADIDDPHHYDIVFNTAYIDVDRCVDPVLAAIKAKFERLAREKGK